MKTFYKGFDNLELKNYQRNFTYEVNKTYKALLLDKSLEKDCSYGLHLFKTIDDCLKFFKYKCIIFECFVDDNEEIIEFKEKIRVQKFFLSDKIVYNFFDILTNYEKYWTELTEEQRELICKYNSNFNYKKYWPELTEYQKDLICEFNSTFYYDKYWKKLTKYQKDLICRYNSNFDYDKHWTELTKYQKDLICKYNSKFDYEKYWNKLTKKQQIELAKRIVIKI